ncbi:MAG: hypothetical protein M1546_07990 [Chloroflexi bacterium]|nr:hypothetical protein [Chloroflexota bacterium]
MIYPLVVAALFAGILLSILLRGRAKLAGLLYATLVPAMMIAVSARAQAVNFRQLTDERAEQVSQAIEAYYVREGHYPHDLGQLTTWRLPSVPRPVIIHGQDWCYDGGGGYYRLGYVYREHWSDPRLTGQTYRTKGAVPDLPGMCNAEITTLQQRQPDFYGLYDE